ncbi:MAG: glycosyltransferase family 2 protein [Planctomycetaceae bacterium]|nr:glycosyltransferase family 2 protein [Planctomycetaceae bacterium]
MEPLLAISIVTYRTTVGQLARCLQSFLAIRLPFVCWVIDNASDPAIEQYCQTAISRFPACGQLHYIANSNTGYGRGHNIAMTQSLAMPSCRYYIASNPDVAFKPGTVEPLVAFMDDNARVGAAMPRILYPDGSLQHLCKLLPTPGHLTARRFCPPIIRKRDRIYTLQHADYNRAFACPCLSGCFMVLRTDALRQVGLFDERFFLYFEDVDLIRRIGRKWQTLYVPFSSVTHGYRKGSYSSGKLLWHHLRSAVQYFSKWGWFHDPERTRMNRETLNALPVKTRTSSAGAAVI